MQRQAATASNGHDLIPTLPLLSAAGIKPVTLPGSELILPCCASGVYPYGSGSSFSDDE